VSFSQTDICDYQMAKILAIFKVEKVFGLEITMTTVEAIVELHEAVGNAMQLSKSPVYQTSVSPQVRMALGIPKFPKVLVCPREQEAPFIITPKRADTLYQVGMVEFREKLKCL
jgi:hypothetical protein